MQHFTAIKGDFGWHIYKGEPDNRGELVTHAGFTHSDLVFDYCTEYAANHHKLWPSEHDGKASIHFDTRGA